MKHPCPEIVSWEELAEGRCLPEQAAHLQAHLKECAACRAVFENVEKNGRFLGALRNAWDASLANDSIGVVAPGTKVSHYEIVGLLGAGGMATVYRATQAQPHRTVALKLMKLGLATRASLRRFEHEAELLGRLQHPGIAHVYEAGIAEIAGHPQPYFAMELIDGERLTEYAVRHSLSARQRLELVALIGEAVHYAHQKGIIHRDLKPSNILVEKSGQPKVLDFGVARATDTDAQITTLHTDVGQLIGTIPYMSPEQASGNSSEVDLRSDVYSLGVVCYELLAGRLPYAVRDKTIPEAIRVIQEDDPTPLSSINRVFRGDLETIVRKALEKDKERRYGAASAFVADIRCYLNNEPISARPPSATYQFSKFARRNRALVGGVTAVFIVLVLGLAGTGYGMVRALAERNRAVDAERAAQTGRDQAESVISLLKQMLSSADPEQVKPKNYTVEQLLNEWDKGLKGKSIGQPEVEAAVRSTIGNAYLGLGHREQAERQLTAALALRREAHGPEHPEVARALCDYAWFLRSDANYPHAEQVLREALAMQRKLLGSNHVETATTLSRLAEVLRNNDRLRSAEQSAREALSIRKQLPGAAHPDIPRDLTTLGWVLVDTGRFEEAKKILEEAIALLRNLHGDQHPLLADSLLAMARTLGGQGDVKGAIAKFEESADVARNVLGAEHHDFGEVLGAYGFYLANIGRYDEAEAPLTEALTINRGVHGDWHLCVASYEHQLGRLYAWSSRAGLAEPHLRQSAAINSDLRGPDHSWTIDIRLMLADTLIALNKDDEALALAEHALVHYSKRYGEKGLETANAKRIAGLALLRSGDTARAEPMLRDAVAVLCGKPENASWRSAVAQSALGECLVATKQYEEAEPLLSQSYEWLRSSKGEDYFETKVALQRLNSFREAQGPSDDDALEPTAARDSEQ